MWHPVTKSINRVSYQDINAWKPSKQANIASFFAKAGKEAGSARTTSMPEQDKKSAPGQETAGPGKDAEEAEPATGSAIGAQLSITQEVPAEQEAAEPIIQQMAPAASQPLNPDEGGGIVKVEVGVKEEQQQSPETSTPKSARKRPSSAQTPSKAKKPRPSGMKSISTFFSPKQER